MLELTLEQQGSFQQFKQAIESEEDITDLLREVSRDNLLSIFRKVYDGNTLLSIAIIKRHWEAVEAILNVAEEKGALKEIVTWNSCEENKGTGYHSIADFIKNTPYSLDVLYTIKESCGLEAFFNTVDEDDRGIIKSILDRNFQSEERIAANKAIKVGGALSIMTALTVGGGYFSADVLQLPMSVLTSMAVIAVLAVGLIAGGIIYVASKPDNKLKKFNIQKQVPIQEITL